MHPTATERSAPATAGANVARARPRPPERPALQRAPARPRHGADRLAGPLAGCVRRRTLARWRAVASGAYAPASPVGSIGSAFTWQEEDVTIQDRPGGAPGKGIQYLEHTPAAPDLKVAADNSIAMQTAAGEAKEVYLDPQVRQNANAALQGVGSPIELGRAGHTVTVPGQQGGPPQRVLEKTRPTVRAANPRAAALNADDFPSLAAVICRDCAQSILGGAMTHIRLGPAGGVTQDVASSTADSNIVTGTQQLADRVARRDTTLAEAATAMALRRVPTPGARYGRATRGLGSWGWGAPSARRRATFGARARALGINEHAWASPGQAYVIQSVYAGAGNTQNYSDPAEANLVGGGFGYHFAAAVAESLDGRDGVTLENYRRSGDIETAAQALLADLRVRYAQQLEEALRAARVFRLTPEDEIGAILHYIETNAAPDFNAAGAKWRQVLGEMRKPGALWFFRMVGRDDPDQSFHRQLAGSGAFASPMTVVMVHQ